MPSVRSLRENENERDGGLYTASADVLKSPDIRENFGKLGFANKSNWVLELSL